MFSLDSSGVEDDSFLICSEESDQNLNRSDPDNTRTLNFLTFIDLQKFRIVGHFYFVRKNLYYDYLSIGLTNFRARRSQIVHVF